MEAYLFNLASFAYLMSDKNLYRINIEFYYFSLESAAFWHTFRLNYYYCIDSKKSFIKKIYITIFVICLKN